MQTTARRPHEQRRPARRLPGSAASRARSSRRATARTRRIALYWLDPATRSGSSTSRATRSRPASAIPTASACITSRARAVLRVRQRRRRRRDTASGGSRPRAARCAAKRVREFAVGSQAEGCVADDENGALYIAEEDGGLWRYSAEPDGGSERTAVDRVDSPDGITADVEGVGHLGGPDGTGLHRRCRTRARTTMRSTAARATTSSSASSTSSRTTRSGIDGVSETDGLDVMGAAARRAVPGRAAGGAGRPQHHAGASARTSSSCRGRRSRRRSACK